MSRETRQFVEIVATLVPYVVFLALIVYSKIMDVRDERRRNHRSRASQDKGLSTS